MTDSLLFWNGVAIEVHRISDGGGTGTKVAAGAAADEPPLGILHLAMYDAYVAIARPAEFAPYLPGLPQAPSGASVKAAVAGAAHEVLSALFPSQRAILDQRLAEAGVRGDPGQAFGRAIGATFLDDPAHGFHGSCEVHADESWYEAA
jgi:vanadium chloroperoxidase